MSENPYIYKSLNEVPPKWKTLKGGRLQLSQINSIIKSAYDNKISTEAGEIPDYGLAKTQFEVSHRIKDNFWVED